MKPFTLKEINDIYSELNMKFDSVNASSELIAALNDTQKFEEYLKNSTY